MQHARRFRAPLAGLIVGTALAWGATPAFAGSPAGLDVTVNLTLYRSCVEVVNAPGTGNVTVIQKRNGNTIATDQVPVTGAEDACLTSLRPGDKVIVKKGTAKRTITLPTMTLTVDLPNDQISGTVPVSGQASFFAAQRIAGFGNSDIGSNFDPEPNGFFDVFVGSDEFDLKGGDPVEIRWESPAGDRFSLFQAAPSVVAEVGRARVSGHGKRGTTFTVTLKNGSTTRGNRQFSSVPGGTAYAGKLRKNGADVPVAAGNTLHHSQAGGTRMTVLTPSLSVEAADNGSLTATCFPNGEYIVLVNGSITSQGEVGPLGLVDVDDLTDGGGDLEFGDTVILGCDNSKGSGQIQRLTVGP